MKRAQPLAGADAPRLEQGAHAVDDVMWRGVRLRPEEQPPGVGPGAFNTGSVRVVDRANIDSEAKRDNGQRSPGGSRDDFQRGTESPRDRCFPGGGQRLYQYLAPTRANKIVGKQRRTVMAQTDLKSG